MDSRFKYLQSVNPQAIQLPVKNTKFSKLMLGGKANQLQTARDMGICVATGADVVTSTAAAETLDKNTEAAAAMNAESEIPCAQKPKILQYDSSLSRNVQNDEESDVMTDDDTNSVNSVDAAFIENELIVGPTQSQTQDQLFQAADVENMDSRLQNLSIGSPHRRDVMNLSQRFHKMDLIENMTTQSNSTAENSSYELKSFNESIVTLSSNESVRGQSTENTERSRLNVETGEVIVLSDSDDVPPNAGDRKGHSTSSNVFSGNVELPSSSAMQRVNQFFDNIPALESEPLDTTAVSSELVSKSENQSIYVSETSKGEDSDDEDSSEHSEKHDAECDSDHDDQPEKNVEDKCSKEPEIDDQTPEQNISDNDIVIDIPVVTSQSDQPRALVRSQSGAKLKASFSSPLRNVNSAIVRNTGGSIKVNAFEDGQVNISAKININIQIVDESDSDDSESGANVTDDKGESVRKQSIESTDKPQKSPPKNDEQNESVTNPAENNKEEDQREVMTTPKQLKKYEFVPPKSMGRSKKNGFETPKKKQETDEEKAAEKTLTSAMDDDQFEVDKTLPIDPKDQALLQQLYGESWKTPEVLRCYSAIKGRPNPFGSRLTQSAHPRTVSYTRVSGGFNIFKRNIATDLDSTRVEEISVIESVEIRELSPLKTDKNLQPELPPPRKQSSPKSKKKTVPSSTAKAKVSAQKNIKNAPQTEPPLKRSNRTVGRLARERLAQICDSDTDDESEVVTPKKRNKNRDTEWKANESASSESNSDPNWFETPANATKAKSVARKGRSRAKPNSDNQLIYLDLSNEEVVEVNESFHSERSESELAEVTRRFLAQDLDDKENNEQPKPRRRKLFTPNNDDFDDVDNRLNEILAPKERQKQNCDDQGTVDLQIPIPSFLTLKNKLLDPKKFNTPNRLPLNKGQFSTPVAKPPERECQTEVKKSDGPTHNDLLVTPGRTYGFLKSLDVFTPLNLCHPDAVKYRNHNYFNTNKEKLTELLKNLFNDNIFNGKLDLPITWNKKLATTAGRCHCSSKSSSGRTARLELSEKVLTSADRLRCTLIHEMCHAATWVFDGDKGHGATWKSWANKVNRIFPELPTVERCHNYDIEYKYTYQCDICESKSHSHSKSKKVENIRCSFCHGPISIYLNKKRKDGQIVQTPVRPPSGFAKFVKEKYKEYKKPGVKHADVMRSISSAFSALSVEEKKMY